MSQAVAPLTEDNLKNLGRGPNEEREEQLLEKMQSLSALLGKVDALMAEPSDTASRPGTSASACSRPQTSGSVGPHPPNGMTRTELQHVQAGGLVQYTGIQSQTAGLPRLRKIDARATKSTIGSLLSWSEE
jgi:hypothetical protein